MELPNKPLSPKGPPLKAAPRLSQMSVHWPDRNERGMDDFESFKTFTINLYKTFHQLVENMKGDDGNVWCEEDNYFNKDKYDPKAYAFQQLIIPLYVSPTTPYHGLLLYHEAGTGKTRTALRTLSQFKDDDDFKLYWVTSPKLKQTALDDLKKDYPAFWNDSKKRTSPFFPGNKRTSEKGKRIAVFSYLEFVNVAQGDNQLYLPYFETRKKDHNNDPFANSVIVIDEAHKIFERTNNLGNGAYQDQRIYENIAEESYKIPLGNGKKFHCKWLLLTATPSPTIEIPTEKTEEVTIAGGTFGTLRLLNLLIDDEANRFKVGDSPEQIHEFHNSMNGLKFSNLVKGLVSFFKPTNWEHMFAYLVPERGFPLASLTTEQIDYIRKAMERCKKYGKQRTEKDKISLAQCYLRRMHWFGAQKGPKMPKDDVRRMITGPLSQENTTNFPGGIFVKGGKERDVNEMNLPLGKRLLQQIALLDCEDEKNFNTKFKHMIISGDTNHASAAYAAVLCMRPPKANLNESCKYEKFKYIDPNDYVEYSKKEDKYVLKKRFKSKETDCKDNKCNGLLFMHNDLRTDDQTKLLELFNNEKNVYGQFARVIVLGSKLKEGVNLYDVKYVHIMEEQLSITNEIQIIGRAVRRCGHINLPDNWNPDIGVNEPKDENWTPDNSQNWRKVHVNIYGLEIPDILELEAPPITTLGGIVNAAMKQGEGFGQKVLATDKIIKWIQNTSIDLVEVSNANELNNKLEMIKTDHLGNFSIAADQRQVNFKNTSTAVTLKELKQKCKEAGVERQDLKKITKETRNYWINKCNSEIPITYDSNGKLLSGKQLSGAVKLPPNVVMKPLLPKARGKNPVEKENAPVPVPRKELPVPRKRTPQEPLRRQVQTSEDEPVQERPVPRKELPVPRKRTPQEPLRRQVQTSEDEPIQERSVPPAPQEPLRRQVQTSEDEF